MNTPSTSNEYSSSTAKTLLRPDDDDRLNGIVIFREMHRCGIVQLNRPQVLNALNLEMVRRMYAILLRWEATKSVIIINSSSAPKIFCAGGDLSQFYAMTHEQTYAFLRKEYALMHLIGSYLAPVVALMDGITMGAGCGLSANGRFRVATENTVFAMPEALLGIHPDVGSSCFLSRLSGELGVYMALTAARLSGWDVFCAGIATHFCQSKRIADLERELRLCNSPADVEAALRRHCVTQRPATTFSRSRQMQQINRCFAADTVEDILHNLRQDGSDWALRTLKVLEFAAPMTLRVILQLLRSGRRLTLTECLKMEYRVSRRFLVDSDFQEGISALIIRKDKAPKWKHTRLEEVRHVSVDQYFVPLERIAELKINTRKIIDAKL